MPRTDRPPRRVVSLLPSTTESLFELGLGDSLVGITDYCVHPEDALAGLPRIGGTKNPDIDRIVGLRPDLVFANQEENTPAAVHGLEAAGIRVHLSFPRTVRQAIEMLYEIADLYSNKAARDRVAELERMINASDPAGSGEAIPVFVPVWEGRSGDLDWWMTINGDTFTHDLLARCGFANVFADRQRRYPLAADLGAAEPEASGERDTRYPRVIAAEIAGRVPRAILLPSEPFAYGQKDVGRIKSALAETPAAAAGKIYLVDGSLLTWPGTRMGLAVDRLGSLQQKLLGQAVNS